MTNHKQLATQLTQKLSLEQKVQLLTGRDFWNTHGIDAVALRNMLLSDGPSGVRGEFWDERDNSLNLPSATAVSSSWDVKLLEELGSVLADEAQRKGVDVVLGPTINLHRSPYGGRHFECFSEDPMLTGALATAYVRGLQAKNIGACPKHYIANDFETNRYTVNVKVDERTLRELYLRPFEDAVVDGGAWTIMSSYNSINGTTATESDLLETPLRTDWDFDGVVISDWTAVRSLESAKAEQDLVMPGPDGPWGQALIDAVNNGEIAIEVIDRKIERLMLLALRVGAVDGSEQTPLNKDRSNTTVPNAGKAFARKAETAGTVLLKNDGILPIDFSKAGKVALIGHNAKAARTQGGGSATVVPDSVVTPFDALTELLGDRMTYEMGAIVQQDIEPLSPAALANPISGGQGVQVEFLDENMNVMYSEERLASHLMWLGSDAPVPTASWTRLRTRYTATETATKLFGFSSMQPVKFLIDGVSHMDEKLKPTSEDPFTALMDPPLGSKPFDFVAGQTYDLDITVDMGGRVGLAIGAMLFVFGFAPDNRDEAASLAAAIESAKNADLAIVVVGTNSKVESEGYDRSSLLLPGVQDKMVEEVLKVNENVLVLVNSGSPVLMPWAEKVKGIMVTYFGGQEMGNALVDVLSGNQEPGGRLPTTWAKTESDLPVHNCTPDASNEVEYEEGIHIGYRAFAKAGIIPLYPFGFGLGYTSWEMQDFSAPQEVAAGNGFTVRATIKNTGSRAGKQVVQVYASRSETAIDRPKLWLAGFASVELGAGENAEVEVSIKGREFANWSEGWQFEAGSFELAAGFDSATLSHTASVVLN